MTVFSSDNVTFGIADYESVIESLLAKNTKKYDIFTYDPLYIEKYSHNFLDVKDLVPKEHLELYSHGDAKKTCVNSKNEWIGLPFFQKYTTLFSNKPLLDKYNKTAPETWEELLETGKYIQKQERERYNNTDFIVYNGMYTTLNALPSVYEFIYSYRDEPDDGFPGFESEAAVEALKMYKRLKREISSDDIYHAAEPFIIESLWKGEGLFMKIWDTPNENQHEKYYITTIPGKKKGLHSALTTSINLGVNKFISEERREVAIKVLEYLTSERIQKDIVVKGFKLNTGMTKLYDDEEVCNILICPLVKEAKTIHREFKYIEGANMDKYCNKITDLFTQCLFGDKSVENALAEIIDITKIYYVTLKDLSGLIMFIILVISTLFMILFLLLPLLTKFDRKFSFFSWDLWLVYCIGYLMVISTGYLCFGDFSDSKCNLRYTLIFTGIYLWNMMIFYKLLMCFPENNKYSLYLCSHRFEFILLTLVIGVGMNLLFLISPYSVQQKTFDNTIDHKNFEKCTMENSFGNIWTLIVIVFNGFIILCNFFLSFIEWNVKEIYEDIRAVVINEYLSAFIMILLIILDYIDINNYNVIFILHITLIIILCITNYYFICSIRLLYNKSLSNDKTIAVKRRSSSSRSDKNVSLSSHSNSSNILTKLINYHYSNYSIDEHGMIISQTGRRNSHVLSSRVDSRMSRTSVSYNTTNNSLFPNNTTDNFSVSVSKL
ncbi:periplasmic binding protein-like II [Anaeromyces robustus]|uniref:Periplasmic binding protein-like II n=1 Tax=Anaeromyces robustus TaxID=1754192 RepID=A0A1Y1XD90_9FUNG|nr:periplasmic binding protein-like II [Anaeromyces robustus]|eukprot:ORX83695.1 periplasmic binding protein-like II [Anaeromyces robustus]